MSKPICQLIGEDGNVFNLVGVVSRCLKQAGLSEQAIEMQNRVFKSGSYEEALSIMMDYVEVGSKETKHEYEEESNGKKFKAGKYYVGDPCYVVSDEDWIPLLEATDYFRNENCEYKGRQIFAEGTAYGDGCFTDNYGREYGVDAGLIGIVPFEVVDERNITGDGGQIIEFDKDFDVYTSEPGVFHFGNIVIDTKGEDEEEETCWKCGETYMYCTCDEESEDDEEEDV